MTLEKLSEKAEVSVSQISRYERGGERTAKVDHLERIAAVFKTTLADISDDASAVAPLISWVSAGKLAAAESLESIEIEDFVSVAGLPKGDYIALRVTGNSMNRIAPDGSVILVNRDDNEPRDGQLYVFAYSDERGSTFKRWKSGKPPRLQPYSHDPDEETIMVRSGILTVGRVRRVIIDI